METAIIVALITSILNLLGILYNYHLSKNLKSADKDDDEKRELMKKIQDSLTGYEMQKTASSLQYSPAITRRLVNIARRVKRHDSVLSNMIRIFIQDWRKYNDNPELALMMTIDDFAELIGDRADKLTTSQSIFELIRAWWSWAKFRLTLAKKNWQVKRLEAKKYES